jgi:hypothetical protein
MRRPIHTTIALLCVFAQLALGASSALGLVICVGRDHAGIERSSDGCCAAHEGVHQGRDESRLDAGCCSDVPLVSATRQLSNGPRSAVPPRLVLALPVPPTPPGVRLRGRRLAVLASPAPSSLALRSIILRV